MLFQLELVILLENFYHFLTNKYCCMYIDTNIKQIDKLITMFLV